MVVVLDGEEEMDEWLFGGKTIGEQEEAKYLGVKLRSGLEENLLTTCKHVKAASNLILLVKYASKRACT